MTCLVRGVRTTLLATAQQLSSCFVSQLHKNLPWLLRTKTEAVTILAPIRAIMGGWEIEAVMVTTSHCVF